MIRHDFTRIRHGAETGRPAATPIDKAAVSPSLFGERKADPDIREVIAAHYYLARSAPGAKWPDDASAQQQRVAFDFAESLVAAFAKAYCSHPLTLDAEVPPAQPLKLSLLERAERVLAYLDNMIQRRPFLTGAIAASTGAGAVIFTYLIAYLIAERVQ